MNMETLGKGVATITELRKMQTILLSLEEGKLSLSWPSCFLASFDNKLNISEFFSEAAPAIREALMMKIYELEKQIENL